MNKIHNIESIKFRDDTMIICVDGEEHNIEINRISKQLSNATDDQRQNYVVSPSGYGLHWPDIDEDLSIDGILGIKHKLPALSSRIRSEIHSMAGF